MDITRWRRASGYALASAFLNLVLSGFALAQEQETAPPAAAARVYLHGRVLLAPAEPVARSMQYRVSSEGIDWEQFRVGDFNGDARADIVAAGTDRREIFVGFNDGASGIKGVHAARYDSELDWKEAVTGIFTEDDLDDLLIPKKSTAELVRFAAGGPPPFTASVFSLLPPGSEILRVFVGRMGGVKGDNVLIFYRQQKAGYFVWGGFQESGFLEVHRERSEPSLETITWAEIDGSRYEKATNTFDSEIEGIRRIGSSDSNPIFCSLPYERSAGGWVSADFTGDGYRDIVAFQGARFGWWICISSGKKSVPVALTGSLPHPPPGAVLRAGDFNGDFLDDVIWWDAKLNAYQLLLFTAGPGVPGVNVRTSEGLVTKTDSDGYYAFRGNALRGLRLTIESPEHAPVRGTLESYAFLKKERANFLVVPRQSAAGRRLAQEPDGFLPLPCVGYVGDNLWGREWGGGACPQNHAYFDTDDSGNPQSDPGLGTCCPLPSSDILTEEHVYVVEECPDSFIVTGKRFDCPECKERVRCTRINVSRYQFGPRNPGAYWGIGFSAKTETDAIRRSAIPASLRYAVGRSNYSKWDVDGCIGAPFGSLLTRLAGDTCAAAVFRELQYRGRAGDPPAGAAVMVLPHCEAIDDVFTPLAACREE